MSVDLFSGCAISEAPAAEKDASGSPLEGASNSLGHHDPVVPAVIPDSGLFPIGRDCSHVR